MKEEKFNIVPSTAVQPMKYSQYMQEFKNKDVVCSRFFDIAFVYHAIKGERPGLYSTDSLITNQDLKKHSLSEELLRRQIFQKLEATAPLQIELVSDVLERLNPQDTFDNALPMNLSVCSAPSLMYSSAVLMYPHFTEAAKAAMQGSFFVIPSSVHEILLLSAKSFQINVKLTPESNLPDFEQMVQDVNKQEVKPNEQLSDLAFYYNAETDTFISSQEYRERIKSIG